MAKNALKGSRINDRRKEQGSGCRYQNYWDWPESTRNLLRDLTDRRTVWIGEAYNHPILWPYIANTASFPIAPTDDYDRWLSSPLRELLYS